VHLPLSCPLLGSERWPVPASECVCVIVIVYIISLSACGLWSIRDGKHSDTTIHPTLSAVMGHSPLRVVERVSHAKQSNIVNKSI